MNSKILLASLFVVFCSCINNSNPQDNLTRNDAKINEIIANMTLEEKVEMFHSKTIMSSEGVPRLGIQDIKYADGPFGIREELGDGFRPLGWDLDYGTYFPTGSALAATWDEDITYKYGTGMGREARIRGKDIILGPAINIQRLPVGGRTYEYLSEDPHLSARLAVAYTKGVQDQGTAVCLKHFALNNQETNRGSVNVIADERTMREIYLKPFEAAVKEAGAMSVMPAYNKINGFYCSENAHLLNEILRDEWGFKGMTVSDWGGTHSTMGATFGGLNVQMTGDEYLGPALIDSVKAGKVPMDVIDAKARDILRVRFAIEAIPEDVANTQMTSQREQQLIAYEVAQKSIVLLKNEGTLPLKKDIKRIAVIGQNAILPTAAGGVGAGVKTLYEITPLDGIKARCGDNIEVKYAPGYKNYAFNPWGAPSTNNLTAKSIDEPLDPQMLKEALALAKEADVVLFFCGTNKSIETEGSDRNDIFLPCSQDELASELRKVNPNLISVIVSGGPCDLRKLEKESSAIVQAWWNGLEGGKALAEVLFGDIAPSGKLPFTFPLKLEDSPAYAMGNFPDNRTKAEGDLFTLMYRDDKTMLSQEEIGDMLANLPDPESVYSEGIFVGYRWYDTKKVNVMYAFGHGLSYVDFAYSDLLVKRNKKAINLSFSVENKGDMVADEVAQVYIRRPNAKVEMPYKELKAFKRASIPAASSHKYELSIPIDELKYWDIDSNSWLLEKGAVEILVGSSSDDIRLKTEINL